jgi:hypothetical protein
MAKAKTALQDIEGRIRRLFKASGEVGLEWTPNLTPVVIAADLTRAGSSPIRGRRWAVTNVQSNLAADSRWFIQPTMDTLITMVCFSGTQGAGGLISFSLFGPDDLTGVAMNQVGAYWIENSTVNDIAPINLSSWTAVGNVGNIFFRALFDRAINVPFPGGLFIPAGGKLRIQNSILQVDAVATVFGEIY